MKNMLNCLDEITAALQTDPARLIEQSEAFYHDELHTVADLIGRPEHRTILAIAGPSGSGKTTTAKLMCSILKQRGVPAEMISLDDFYLGVGKTPVDENGKQDFESISALNLERIHACFRDLAQSGACDLPVFDFNTGEPASHTRRITLEHGGVAIVEGLHAINPRLISAIGDEHIIKLFVNVDTRVLDENGEVAFSRRDLRLMRRASRDLIYRNSPLSNTLRMWPDVVAGEEKNLFPHKDTADRVINTFHPYEPAVFRARMLNCIAGIDREAPAFHYVERIERSLNRIPALDETKVPENSLLREFL